MAMRLNKNVEKLDVYKPAEPYSKVSIYVGVDQNGDEVYYTAGDDSGKELLIECPWGTSTMASVLLAKIGGYAYNGYDAKKAILNPAAELGDAVNVDGVASRIYAQKTNFDALYSSDIAAPPNEEIDDDYTYYSPDIKATRKLATTVATLRVNVDTIEAQVTGKIDDAEAETLIKAALNNITLSVSTGTNTNTSKITLTGDGISAVSDNITLTANSINLNTCTISGKLTATNINANNITATGVDITGTITATQGSFESCNIKNSCTLLSNSNGTSYDDTPVMWIGSHQMTGTISSHTKLIGTYMGHFYSSSNTQEGIVITSEYMPSTSTDEYGQLFLTSKACYLSIDNKSGSQTGITMSRIGNLGVSMTTADGINATIFSVSVKKDKIKLMAGADDSTNTYIEITNGEITFKSPNGTRTLSQIIART